MKGKKLVAGTFNFLLSFFRTKKKDKSNLFFRLRFWFLLQFRRCLAWAKWQSGRGKTSPWGVPLKETPIRPSPGQKKWVWHAAFVFCGIFCTFILRSVDLHFILSYEPWFYVVHPPVITEQQELCQAGWNLT